MIGRLKRGVVKLNKMVVDVIKGIKLSQTQRGYVLLGVGLGVGAACVVCVSLGVRDIKLGGGIEALEYAIKIKELKEVLGV